MGVITMKARKKASPVPTTHNSLPFTFIPNADTDARIVQGLETDVLWIKEYIHRKRRQMIIHSIIYYRMDENVITDDTWQCWANELAAVQKHYPYHCNIGFHDELFKGWDGSTGMHLDLQEYYGVALEVIRIANSYQK